MNELAEKLSLNSDFLYTIVHLLSYLSRFQIIIYFIMITFSFVLHTFYSHWIVFIAFVGSYHPLVYALHEIVLRVDAQRGAGNVQKNSNGKLFCNL